VRDPLYPSLYQINTRVWLTELSRALGRPATLDDIPDGELDRLASVGFDWVWFLSVWQIGPAGRRVSRANPEWRKEFEETLPDLREDDIAGSGFAITAYSVGPELGGDEALARLRDRLRKRGLRLLLDFVPNHTALDHPWVDEHPEYYVRATAADLAQAPQNYIRIETRRGDLILAYGRDPYFAGWPDTFQLNYRHAGFREAQIAELGSIAQRCDGVRCDMAMLLQPQIIQRTWGDRAQPSDGSPPRDAPFWPEAIAAIRRRHPPFLFMAEVYWDMEWELQQAGFDFTYDKRLYDRLVAGAGTPVREHLGADGGFQDRSVRFLENHDEPRAAATFPHAKHEAAAVVAFTARGLRFLHEGQLEGRRAQVSMHVGRRPAEPVDERLQTFYGRLLACLRRPELHDGEWKLASCRPAWAGNPSHLQFIVSTWQSDEQRLLIAVNYGPTQAQTYASVGLSGLRGRGFTLVDLMSDARYVRAGDDLANGGLYLDLPPWGYNIFELVG